MQHLHSYRFNAIWKLTIALLIFAFAGTANAALVYAVSDTSVNNCSAHGLWTGTSLNRSVDRCANYFSISGFLTIADDQSGGPQQFGMTRKLFRKCLKA